LRDVTSPAEVGTGRVAVNEPNPYEAPFVNGKSVGDRPPLGVAALWIDDKVPTWFPMDARPRPCTKHLSRVTARDNHEPSEPKTRSPRNSSVPSSGSLKANGLGGDPPSSFCRARRGQDARSILLSRSGTVVHSTATGSLGFARAIGREPMTEDRERLGLAVLALEPLLVLHAIGIDAQEEHGGFGAT